MKRRLERILPVRILDFAVETAPLGSFGWVGRRVPPSQPKVHFTSKHPDFWVECEEVVKLTMFTFPEVAPELRRMMLR